MFVDMEDEKEYAEAACAVTNTECFQRIVVVPFSLRSFRN